MGKRESLKQEDKVIHDHYSSTANLRARKEALELAVNSSSTTDGHEHVVRKAQAYYDFLTGVEKDAEQ